MINKNIYQCTKHCKECTYENKNPDGYDGFSECQTDKCPSNNYKLGYIDVVGGRHTEEGNWNPKGEFCSLCNEESCESCNIWKNRQQEIKSTPKITRSNIIPDWNAIFDDVIDFKDSSISSEKETILQPIETNNIEQENIENTESLQENKKVLPEDEETTQNIDQTNSFPKTIVEDKVEDIIENNEEIKDSSNEKMVSSLSEPSITIPAMPKPLSPFDDDVEFDFFKKKDNKETATPSLCSEPTEINIQHVEQSIEETSIDVSEVSKDNEPNINEEPSLVSATTEQNEETTTSTDSDDDTIENNTSSQEESFIEDEIPKTPPKSYSAKNIATSLIDKLFKKNKKNGENNIFSKTEEVNVSEPPIYPSKQSFNKDDKIEKNKYIKSNWLDDELDVDYDDEGNIVQGIYRIDKDGNKKIITAFDDDTNVRYIKTGKISMLAPVKGLHDETRIADTTTDAWQNASSNEETENYPDGIVASPNQDSSIEIVNIKAPDANADEEISFGENLNSDIYEDDELEDEIDFGETFEDYEDGLEFDDGYNDAMFEEEDEIPEPEEYKAEREEYENMGIETEEAEEIDEDYEDADFEMSDSMKFKASLLSPIGEEIARLQLNNSGVLLSVLGDCKITVKGRNDAEGFSYKDAKRFPRYIINTVLDKSIYRDPNMEVIDHTYFNITYFEIKSGEIIPIDDVRLDIKFDNPTPDNVKQILYNEYKKFKN